jgi:hypothetical protein
MLQLALRQRCAAVAARVAATLRSSRRCSTIATGVALTCVAAMAGRATLLCSDGRWPAPKFIYLFIFKFLLDSFKERTKARQREKRQGFKTNFSALLVGLNVTQKLPLVVTVVATCAPSLRSLRQQQHHTSSNNSRTSKVQEICCFQHEAIGNRVFLKLK